MRWFINSTKETSGFNDNNNFQAQIDTIKKKLDVFLFDAQKMDGKNFSKFEESKSRIDVMVNEINNINDIVNDIRNDAITRSNTIHDEMKQKGIQINIILKHQGNQYERIAELEKGMEKFKGLLRTAFNTITDLDNKVKALENRIMPQQSIPDAKAKKLPKFRRLRNTFGDAKFTNVYAIATGYVRAGFKQDAIAGKLNGLGFKTPHGMDFTARHVSDLLCNPVQKSLFYAKWQAKT